MNTNVQTIPWVLIRQTWYGLYDAVLQVPRIITRLLQISYIKLVYTLNYTIYITQLLVTQVATPKNNLLHNHVKQTIGNQIVPNTRPI